MNQHVNPGYMLYCIYFYLNMSYLKSLVWDAWVAQQAEWLPSSQVRILGIWDQALHPAP